jgi:5-methylcytosine-specific restriction enzyme A
MTLKIPNPLSNKRPPNWEREELILALDLYFKLSSNQFEETNPSVIELSRLLNKIADLIDLEKSEKFRNPAGVASKLHNFSHLETGKGRSHVGTNDRKIWGEFSNNQEKLHIEADKIRLGIEEEAKDQFHAQPSRSILDSDAADFPEGRIRYFMHKRRERNSKNIKKFKSDAEKKGKLFCEACGFDFYCTYGDVGKGFIECHHLKPLSEYEPNENTAKENLVLICSNCHKIVHKYRPWLRRHELQKILRRS